MDIVINDYLSKADEEIAKNVMYRVYGMPGPLFMENEVTPTPEPEPKPSLNIPFYVENITQETETLTISGIYPLGGKEVYLEFPVEYSTDGTTWEQFGTTGKTKLTKTLSPGDKVYLRAQTDSWTGIECSCIITGVSKVGGNIMSLLYGSSFTGNETEFPSESNLNFSNIFNNLGINEVLTDASELILPSTTLTEGCYRNMFRGCTSLIQAPELPATTLAGSCYGYMFYGCTSLNEVTIYANDVPDSGCLESWLDNVASSGKFHNLGTATFISDSECPLGWIADHPEYVLTVPSL